MIDLIELAEVSSPSFPLTAPLSKDWGVFFFLVVAIYSRIYSTKFSELKYNHI